MGIIGGENTFLGSNLSVLHPHSSWKGLYQLDKVVDYPITLNLNRIDTPKPCNYTGMNHKSRA